MTATSGVLLTDAFLFWFLAIVTLVSALAVVLMVNPLFSALSLVMSMVGVAALFVTMQAYFLAGVQLIVYAGAVMVLFVMVLMLFDLNLEKKAFSRGPGSSFLKIASVGLFAGLLIGGVVFSELMTAENVETTANLAKIDGTRALGRLLFEQYLWGFEVLGVLLLVVAIGAVALSRSKGGTHAKH